MAEQPPHLTQPALFSRGFTPYSFINFAASRYISSKSLWCVIGKSFIPGIDLTGVMKGITPNEINVSKSEINVSVDSPNPVKIKEDTWFLPNISRACFQFFSNISYGMWALPGEISFRMFSSSTSRWMPIVSAPDSFNSFIYDKSFIGSIWTCKGSFGLFFLFLLIVLCIF